MIQANELRIGNLFAMNDFPMYVEAIFRDTVYLNFEGNEGDVWEEDIKDLVPIPLTEEILIKAGFEKCRKGYSLNVGGESFDYYIKGEFVLWYHKNKGYSLDTISKSRDRFYNNLHELQNLIFALTGEEIKIELV